MPKIQKFSLFALRIVLGWMFFWAGITKILDPNWSAAGYIKGAQTTVNLYEFLLSPNVLPIVNFLNEWGLTLLGVSLILGVFIRFSAPLGAVLMLTYYLALGFPYPDAHSFVVDNHIIYIVALLTLWSFNAGRIWGIDRKFS